METELGLALADCGTSGTWSTLDAVAGKVGKKLGKRVTPRELDAVMLKAGKEGMKENGVWRTSFGKKYMPIIVVNPSFRRALEREGGEQGCTCLQAKKGDGGDKRYFGSQDYNAGRHKVVASGHKLNCCMWLPPETSHLHSWRRGFTEPGFVKK